MKINLTQTFKNLKGEKASELIRRMSQDLKSAEEDWNKKREEQTEMGVGKLRLKIMSAVALDFRALKRHTKKAGKPAPLWSF